MQKLVWSYFIFDNLNVTELVLLDSFSLGYTFYSRET